jgi:adenosylcobinamide-phosphate synthase
MILLLALVIDALVGDPPGLYRRVPHPVAALGRLIAVIEGRLNRTTAGDAARFTLGVATAAAVIGGAGLIGWGLARGLALLPGGWIAEAILASTLIAFRGLERHVGAVADGLERGLDAGREAVGHIVGRDPATLDSPGVARAAIESLAENFSDGVVAPVFWYAVLGLPGLCAYKAVNTLDSMIGHRDARYAVFGRASARIDDAVNWIPARLAGGLIAIAALGRAPAAFGAMRRDAARHRSVNAGWQEAAMAGALGLALAGPRRYGGVVVEDAWMGDGRREATSADIRRALALYRRAGTALAVLLAAGLAL